MTTTTTPLLGLNKPGKGDFNWDVPLNENWDKLDSLGAGRLPFMAPLLMEHIMDAKDSIGWALQGSALDGDVYTTAWDKLSTAKNRASTQTLTYKGISFDVQVDSVTKWRFVSKETYDNAKENLGNSLGFVVDYVEGAKRIILPYKTGFLSLGDEPGVYTPEGLPNISGKFVTTRNGAGVQQASGPFTAERGSDWGPDWESGVANYGFNFDASKANPIYGASEHVTPENTSMFLYYRVANTVTTSANLDLNAELASIKARLAALEGE